MARNSMLAAAVVLLLTHQAHSAPVAGNAEYQACIASQSTCKKLCVRPPPAGFGKPQTQGVKQDWVLKCLQGARAQPVGLRRSAALRRHFWKPRPCPDAAFLARARVDTPPLSAAAACGCRVLDEQGLTGTVPTEVGTLTALTQLCVLRPLPPRLDACAVGEGCGLSVAVCGGAGIYATTVSRGRSPVRWAPWTR
jgi:hypothetical protein